MDSYTEWQNKATKNSGNIGVNPRPLNSYFTTLQTKEKSGTYKKTGQIPEWQQKKMWKRYAQFHKYADHKHSA